MIVEPIVGNPHWVGNEPAWDIILTNGDVHLNVTIRDIRKVLQELLYRDKIHNYESYIIGGVVRKYHIDYYDRYLTGRF